MAELLRKQIGSSVRNLFLPVLRSTDVLHLEPAAKANGRSVGWPVGPLHLSCPARQRSLTVDVLSFECIASCCQAHNKTPALGGGLSGGQSSLLGLRDVNLLQPCHQAIHNEVSGRNCSVSKHSPAMSSSTTGNKHPNPASGLYI